MATVPTWVILVVLLAPAVGLLLLIEQAWVRLPPSVSNIVRKVLVALVVVGFGALGTRLVLVIMEARLLFGGRSFTKSVEVTTAGPTRGYYYRVKASYTYKGEPLDFDVVVGCNVSVTTYKDNGRTVEVSIAPMVYGLKMKDGRGVVIELPKACRGETTENGKVPETFQPLIVTYQSADAPWFGLAYATEDAYASPISELKFFGATISRATFEEWQEWRRTEAAKNFVTYELLGINKANIWEAIQWKPGYRAMGSECRGFSFVKIPEAVRDAMRPFWPSTKPRYWYPNEDARRTFYDAGEFKGWIDKTKRNVLFDGHPLYSYLHTPPNKPEVKFLSKDSAVGALYPALSDVSLNRLDQAGELPPEIKAKTIKSFADVTIDPKLKGFAYCDTEYNIAGKPSNIGLQLLTSRVNGESISEDTLTRREWSFDYAFERDEYVFFFRRYPMADAFGGL
jgi:hypothetical protein